MNDAARGAMPPLRTALKDFLADWQRDVAPAWQGVLAGLELDFDGIPEDGTLGPDDRIFPLRRGHGVEGVPEGSHVLRALDGVAPDDVRVVLIGQDPYPEIARATGRSFEPGDFSGWHAPQAKSFRRIEQGLVQHRHPDPAYVAEDAWDSVLARVDAGRVPLSTPKEQFDHWERQGVLFLNLGLTFSRFFKPIQEAHMALWRPVVEAVLTHLVQRPAGELAVVLWGGEAQDAFASMGVVKAAEAAGRQDKLATVKRRHPAFDRLRERDAHVPFLELPDAFTQVNDALVSLGGKPIPW